MPTKTKEQIEKEKLKEKVKQIKLENKFDRLFHKKGDNPNPFDLKAKGGRAGYQSGGRTDLIEELGRVEAEPSNRNRRAEISRVHGELNRGYKSGGRTGLKHGGSAGAAKRGHGAEIK